MAKSKGPLDMVLKLLKNKYVGYAVMAFAAIHAVGYFTARSYECLALFAVTVVAVKHLTKNLTLALLGALLASNFLFGCGRVIEGSNTMSATGKLAEAVNLTGDAEKQLREQCEKDGKTWKDGVCEGFREGVDEEDEEEEETEQAAEMAGAAKQAAEAAMQQAQKALGGK